MDEETTIARHGPIRIDRRPQGDWRLACTQHLPGLPEAVFPFFGAARNLERITPPFLRFRIRRVRGEPFGKDSVIDYRLRLHGLPIHWRTLIEVWEPPRRFVDLQVRGPFRAWRHEHTFEAAGGRTLVTDTVDFDLYCRRLACTPVLGWLRWIEADLRAIFAYRQQAVAAAFDAAAGDPPPAAGSR